MRKFDRTLVVCCALDADVCRQIARSRPATDVARCDSDVVQCLRRAYRHVRLLPVDEDDDTVLVALKRIRPDVVFNLAYSGLEREPSFAALLDFAGVAYTGSGPVALALADNKIRARHLLRAAGILVPRFVELASGVPRLKLQPPLLVKPARLTGCSFGIYRGSLVDSMGEALACAKRLRDRFDVATCEEFIVGRELRVGIVEDARTGNIRVAGITECFFAKARPGWGFKTEAIRINPRVRRANGVESRPARLSAGIRSNVDRIAAVAMKTLNLHGYATLDIRLSDSGQLVVVDVNANPGLSRRSHIWTSPSFTHTLGRIIHAALARRSRSLSARSFRETRL
jgi:D-alanine-D-alanine ligase